jgi:hypothetical protein
MNIEDLRTLHRADPFHPYVIHMADGRNYAVQSKEFLLIPPHGRTIVLWQPDEGLHLIDTFLVTELEIKPSRNGRRRRK